MPFRRETGLSRRAVNVNASNPFGFRYVNLLGDALSLYTGTVYIDGHPFDVQLDSGSFDLWVDSTNVTFTNVTDTKLTAGVVYGDGGLADGEVMITQVQFGDFVVDQQAFINAPGSNATSVGDLGILGIGPPPLASIKTALANSSFNSNYFLQNVFSQNSSLPNIMTWQMTRSDLGIVDGGIFTIGEVVQNLSAVQAAPKLPVPSPQWITVMDSLVVNGQNLTGHGLIDSLNASEVPAEFKGKLITLLDTGTSVITAPQFYVDAIYKNVPGVQAVADAPPGFYFVPCETKFNVSAVFAGIEYPIHPMDLIRVDSSEDNSTAVCINTIVYNSPNTAGQDFIFGDAFLRNVYVLFDFGNFTNPSAAAPFVQLLSTTDPATASQQFDVQQPQKVQQWIDLMISPNNSSSSSSKNGSTSTGDSTSGNGALSDSSDDQSTLLRNTYIIMGLLGGVIVLLGAIAVMQVMGSRSGAGKGRYKEVPSGKPYGFEGAYSD